MQNLRFLIDLTTSREYKGHNPVGIVRTEREIAKAFLSSGHSVGFFRFDATRKILWTIPRTEAAAIVGASKSGAFDAQSSGVAVPCPDTTTDERLCTYLGQLHDWLEASAKKAPVSRSLSAPHEEQLELFDGDVVISAGLLWDGNFLEVIYAQKQSRELLVIQVIYDIIPILMPEFCVPGMNIRFPKFLLDAAWTADALYCISDCTLRDVGNYLRDHALPEPRLSRIELGADPLHPQNNPTALSRTLKPGGFILYVSTIEPRKNHAMLFHVWRILFERELEHLVPLVIVGRHGWNATDLISMMQASERLYPQYVKIMTEVSDADLDWLYRNANFTVYPSLYEGWGLPVAESLARGKLCIAAETSSIPEVSAGLAELIDPLDTVAWTRAIGHFLRTPLDVVARERSIRERYRIVSWDDAMLRFVSSVARFVECEWAAAVDNEAAEVE